MIERPFWNFLMNLCVVKWFCNLKISKKIMSFSIFQKIFNCEMITYLFYGVLATVLNWGSYWILCLIFNIPINSPTSDHAFLSLIANSLAFIIALIFAFATNKYIVFKAGNTSLVDTTKEFIYFTLARLFTFFLESAILTVSSIIGLNLIFMKIVAGIIVVILNYVFSKLFIFKKKEQNNDII